MSAAANATAIQAAAQSGQLGLSFSGAGFLIFYYVGAVEVLSRLGVIKPGTKIAGASSGALISTSSCAGLAPSATYAAAHKLAKLCRAEQSCSGTLDAHLRQTLEAALPADAWKRCKDRGFVSLSTGQVLLGDSKPMLVADYKSQEDLIKAAACSSFIPLWSAPSLSAEFRGLQVHDGGFALFQPCPEGVSVCVRISSRNPSWKERGGISGFLARFGFGAQQQAREASTAKTYPPIEATGKDGGADPALLKLAASSNVDIAPGVFHRMPFSQDQWWDWSFAPADDGSIKHMYELGKADTEAWAVHVGLTGKADKAAAQRRATPAAASTAKQQPPHLAAGAAAAEGPAAADAAAADAAAPEEAAAPALKPAAASPAAKQPASDKGQPAPPAKKPLLDASPAAASVPAEADDAEWLATDEALSHAVAAARVAQAAHGRRFKQL